MEEKRHDYTFIVLWRHTTVRRSAWNRCARHTSFPLLRFRSVISPIPFSFAALRYLLKMTIIKRAGDGKGCTRFFVVCLACMCGHFDALTELASRWLVLKNYFTNCEGRLTQRLQSFGGAVFCSSYDRRFHTRRRADGEPQFRFDEGNQSYAVV